MHGPASGETAAANLTQAAEPAFQHSGIRSLEFT